MNANVTCMEVEKNSQSPFSSTEELIAEIQAGRMIILLDDEDRENEGDIIMAASHVTAQSINFMARFGRGLICMPMTPERAERLNLRLMVNDNQSPYSTNFTVSIEAAEGVTTGISAADRAKTIQVAAAAGAVAEHVVTPGHIFPLVAKAGGVLARAGHTEAAVDIVKMAYAGDSGVLVEVLNEDGSMARRDDCIAFAKQHGLKIGTIADLIQHRLAHEKTIEEKFRQQVQTRYGEFTLVAFQDKVEQECHLALVKGHIEGEQSCTVRVHIADLPTDLLGIVADEAHWTLGAALTEIAAQPSGVLVLLGKQQAADELLEKLSSNSRPLRIDYRHVGVGSQILQALGVKKMRLLTQAKRLYTLSGFDLEVTEHVKRRENHENNSCGD